MFTERITRTNAYDWMSPGEGCTRTNALATDNNAIRADGGELPASSEPRGATLDYLCVNNMCLTKCRCMCVYVCAFNFQQSFSHPRKTSQHQTSFTCTFSSIFAPFGVDLMRFSVKRTWAAHRRQTFHALANAHLLGVLQTEREREVGTRFKKRTFNLLRIYTGERAPK